MILIFFLKVCPSFGAALIKGILDRFVPDEFCPDAIPEAVLQVLDSGSVELQSIFSIIM